HGIYPAAGEDRWVAIVCRNDSEWRALCASMNREDLAGDSRFSSTEARRDNREVLDEIVGGWSGTLNALAVESLLQSRGVPAYQVQNSTEAYRDPQFLGRGHFVDLDHPRLGKFTVEGPRAKLLRTPAAVRGAAPSLGQHNQYVLEEILGYSEE